MGIRIDRRCGRMNDKNIKAQGVRIYIYIYTSNAAGYNSPTKTPQYVFYSNCDL